MDYRAKEKLVHELENYYGKGSTMIKFFMKNIVGAVALEDGYVFCFEKMKIQQEFSFSYSDEESKEIANERKNAIENNFDTFVNANMSFFNSMDYFLRLNNTKVYKLGVCLLKDCHMANILTSEDLAKKHWENEHQGPISNMDRVSIKIELEKQKLQFRKRLETYWNKFGSSKLRIELKDVTK